MYYLIAISSSAIDQRGPRLPREVEEFFRDVTYSGHVTGLHDRLAHGGNEARYIAEHRGLPLTDMDLTHIAEIARSNGSQIEIYQLEPLDVMKRKPSK